MSAVIRKIVGGCRKFLHRNGVCNAYTIRPKVGAKEIAKIISEEIGRLPSPLVRRGGPGIVLLGNGGNFSSALMRWGFDHPKYKLVNNARSESLSRSGGMWTQAFAERRCLVPISTFYEWQELPSGTKQTHEFKLPDGEWMWVAGLYEEVGVERHYATITTEPNAQVAPFHDRLLAVVEFEEGLSFLRGEKRSFAPCEQELVIEPCASPLKKAKSKKDDGQEWLF